MDGSAKSFFEFIIAIMIVFCFLMRRFLAVFRYFIFIADFIQIVELAQNFDCLGFSFV